MAEVEIKPTRRKRSLDERLFHSGTLAEKFTPGASIDEIENISIEESMGGASADFSVPFPEVDVSAAAIGGGAAAPGDEPAPDLIVTQSVDIPDPPARTMKPEPGAVVGAGASAPGDEPEPPEPPFDPRAIFAAAEARARGDDIGIGGGAGVPGEGREQIGRAPEEQADVTIEARFPGEAEARSPAVVFGERYAEAQIDSLIWEHVTGEETRGVETKPIYATSVMEPTYVESVFGTAATVAANIIEIPGGLARGLLIKFPEAAAGLVDELGTQAIQSLAAVTGLPSGLPSDLPPEERIKQPSFKIVNPKTGKLVTTKTPITDALRDRTRLGRMTAQLAQLWPDAFTPANLADALLPEPRTMAGKTAQGLTQFFGPYMLALRLKAIAAIPGAIKQATVAGALAEFVAFKGTEDNIADFMLTVPALKQPYVEWLAADDQNIGEIEKRLRNTLVGAGLGLATEPLLMLFKMGRSVHIARREQRAAARAELDAKASADPKKQVAEPPPDDDAAAAFGGLAEGPAFTVRQTDEPVETTFRDDIELLDPELAKRLKIERVREADVAAKSQREATQAKLTASADESADLLETVPEDVGVRAVSRGATVEGAGRAAAATGVVDVAAEATGKAAPPTATHPPTTGVAAPGETGGVVEGAAESAAETTAEATVAAAEDVAERIETPIVNKLDQVDINFAAIDTQDETRAVIRDMAAAMKPQIEAAQRGKRTHAQTQMTANQEDAWALLQKRTPKGTFNAEQTLAVRELWTQSSDKLFELAKLAEAVPTNSNMFAFRKMFATHAMIQKEVLAIRTETARALNAWKIPAGSSARRAKQLDDAIYAMGGDTVNRAMAARVARMLKMPGGQAKLEKQIQKSLAIKSMDALQEFWINGLLTGLHTHAVNFMSNSSVAALRIAETATARGLGILRGTEGGVEAGEVWQMVYGMFSGIADGFRYAEMTIRNGETGNFDVDFAGRGREGAEHGKAPVAPAAGGSAAELQPGGPTLDRRPDPGRAVSAAAFGRRKDDWLAKTVDLIGAGINLPGTALVASDELFKTINYRASIRQLAVRQAVDDVASGQFPEFALKERVAFLIENPTNEMRISSVDDARYYTFTQKAGEVASGFKRVRQAVPLMQFLLPFINTPANIMKFTFERTPMAPMMAKFRANIAEGGVTRDMAQAQMGLGVAVSGWAFDLAMRGQITGGGPKDANERQALKDRGWRPYSIQVGDRWFATNRLDPLGFNMGMVADTFEIFTADDFSDGFEFDELLAMVGASVASNMMNKTYFRSIAQLATVMSDPKRYSENFMMRQAASFVPVIVKDIRQWKDPVMRYQASVMDAMKNRIPMLSEGLPPRRNDFGQVETYGSGLGETYDFVHPMYSGPTRAKEPIFTAMKLSGISLLTYSRRLSYGNKIYFNTKNRMDIYSRYKELAGNALKHPHRKGANGQPLGQLDLMNAIVTGKHKLSRIYEARSDGEEGGKERFLRQIRGEYAEMARRQLLDEFPEIKLEVDAQHTERRRRQ